VANPRIDRAKSSGAATGGATIDTRAHRLPRAANDNATSFSRSVAQLFPLLVLAVVFLWVLSRIYFR
jgi:hypothetical protein